jgi:hypothetical protein
VTRGEERHSGTPRIIDADTHLIETRDLWAGHLARSERDLAVRITDDDLGWAWHPARRPRTSTPATCSGC